MSAPSDFGSFRFSSEQLRPVDRGPFFRDVMSRTLARIAVETVDENFGFEARIYRAPDLSVAWISEGEAVRLHRTRQMAAEGSPRLALVINLDGAAMYSQLGREATISAGSAVLRNARLDGRGADRHRDDE